METIGTIKWNWAGHVARRTENRWTTRGRCLKWDLAWDVSAVAPTPFGFFASFLCVCVCVCVLHYKFILFITRGAPNKAVKKTKKLSSGRAGDVQGTKEDQGRDGGTIKIVS